MDGCTGGRRDVRVSGSRGKWQARLGFCFLLTARSHITSSDVGWSNLSSVSSPFPSFPPSSTGLWIIFQLGPVLLMPCHSVCLHGYVYVCSVCMCAFVLHTRTHTQPASGPWPIPSGEAWRLSPSGHLEVGILQSAAATLWLDYIIWWSVCVFVLVCFCPPCIHANTNCAFIYTHTIW